MTFRDLLGQGRAVALIQRALAADRAPQAYLFTGPEGVGKRTAALILAKAVNCGQGGGVDACGACVACRKIEKGIHPDVRVLEPDGASLKIEQVRDLAAALSLRPYEGRRKVAILDSADSLTEAAANAFLKTLEEPPGATLLVLIAALPSALLPTIRSRCQEVRFGPIPEDLVAAALADRKGLDLEAARSAARLARGSLGRALGLDPEAVAAWDGVVRETWDALGDVGALLDRAERLAADKEGLPLALEALAAWARDLALVQAAWGADRLAHPGLAAEAARWAARLPRRAIAAVYDAALGAQENLLRNANARLTVEGMLLTMRDAVRGPRDECRPFAAPRAPGSSRGS